MISIITVVRNGASTIERTISSVINQDYPDFEYIVIDGISTDGTLEILHKYADKITSIISESDAGIYDAMNKGVKLATGDWIYFLGCDDVIYNNSTLSTIFSTTKYEGIDVVYGNVQFLHSNKIYDGEFDEMKMCDMSICQQAIFYRRYLFQKYGYFDTDYKTAADHVFNIKVYCSNTKRFLYIDKIISTYNELGASKSPESKFLDRSFAIRYDNFKALNSKYILSKIFWSSYFRFLMNNNIRISMNYLFLVIGEVGMFRLITDLFIVIRNKYLKAKN